jgi:hypothetical protein
MLSTSILKVWQLRVPRLNGWGEAFELIAPHKESVASRMDASKMHPSFAASENVANVSVFPALLSVEEVPSHVSKRILLRS